MAGATLFVYGSFVEGQVHYKKIEPFVESKKAARTMGSVYRLEVGFPVFLANNQQSVSGWIVQLKDSDFLIHLLDEFHGYNPKNPDKCLFIRTALSVEVEGEGSATTFVYAINPNKLPKTAKLITDGDWEKDLISAQPVTHALTDSQRKYISKLGASTGREIVPINLELYRELMNKGLIVDKGRRLALTPLGKEVFRYLSE